MNLKEPSNYGAGHNAQPLSELDIGSLQFASARAAAAIPDATVPMS